MSTETTNLKLIKPELTDAADITAMNANWDKIDESIIDLRQRASRVFDPAKSTDDWTVPGIGYIHVLFEFTNVGNSGKRLDFGITSFLKNATVYSPIVMLDSKYAYRCVFNANSHVDIERIQIASTESTWTSIDRTLGNLYISKVGPVYP